ncbi:MAG: hypothetical protein AAF703_02850 [Cyanobacteria bacterium P01_D01_bin.105]
MGHLYFNTLGFISAQRCLRRDGQVGDLGTYGDFWNVVLEQCETLF